MIKTFKINTTSGKVEFWIITGIFAIVMAFFITDGLDQGNAAYETYFSEAGLTFDFYKHYFIPQLIRNITLFASFLVVNFILVPQLISRQRLPFYVVWLLLLFLIVGIVFGLTDYYLRAFIYRNNPGNTTQVWFSQGLEHVFILFVALLAYTILKYVSISLLGVSQTLESKFRFIRSEAIVATFIWLVLLIFLIWAKSPGFATAAWIMVIPTAIILYLLGFYTLIPSSLKKKYPFVIYVLKNSLLLFLALMAWGLILKLVVGGIIGGDKAPLAVLWILNSVLQLLITVPITWLLYKREMKGIEQVNILKKELGQSAASFDFLRSQINPHFLFNALNTLYGTAIQENAERTSEGIQRLGDMMRFMLQENMQDKIPLVREIEYLNNYINLQKLRIGNSPNVQINTEIPESNHLFQIAPMLLIPFVENAFKHGISLREPSFINVVLQTSENTLHLNVTNSKHARPDQDPEKDKSGIGLKNVQQRLMLVYPNKHELIIRDSNDKFFIYLTLQLS